MANKHLLLQDRAEKKHNKVKKLIDGITKEEKLYKAHNLQLIVITVNKAKLQANGWKPELIHILKTHVEAPPEARSSKETLLY